MPVLLALNPRKFLAIGLIGVALAMCLRGSLLSDDFLRGAWMGLSVAFEIVGLGLAARQRRGGKGCCPRPHPLAG